MNWLRLNNHVHKLCWYVLYQSFSVSYLTNEFAKKAEKTILSAWDTTRPRVQAGVSWLETKGYVRGSVARDSHLRL